MKILETIKLKKYYGSGNTLVRALDGVDLSIEKGRWPPSWEPPAAENPPC